LLSFLPTLMTFLIPSAKPRLHWLFMLNIAWSKPALWFFLTLVLLPSLVRADDFFQDQLTYDNGTKLKLADDSFVRLNLSLQPRYSFIAQDEERDQSSFSLRRARVIVSGQPNKQVTYRISAGLAEVKKNQESRPELVDAQITWNALENLGIRFGQFKSALSRQYGSSSHTLQFPERTLVSGMTVSERRRGAAFLSSFSSGQVQLGAGIFNSYGARESSLPTNRHFYLANIRLNPIGLMNPYEEGDYSQTEDLAVSFGAAYGFSPSDGSNALEERQALSVDGNVKYRGFSLHSEFFWNRFGSDSYSYSASTPIGFYAQSGYFILPQRLEAAIRYSYIDCDQAEQAAARVCAGQKEIHQPAVSVNYWFYRQLRAQLGYDFLKRRGANESGSSLSTSLLVLQINGYF